MLQAIELVKHALTNLEPLGAFAVAASGGLSIIAELEALAAFFSQVEQFISLTDPDAVRAAFETIFPIDPAAVPCTSTLAASWVPEKRKHLWAASRDAGSAQAYVGKLVVAAGRVAALVEGLMAIIGNLQGWQLSTQIQSILAVGQNYLQLFSATYQRVEISKVGDEVSSQAALDCIIERISEGLQ